MFAAAALIIMNRRRFYALVAATGERVERIAITRGGDVEVLTENGETRYYKANELVNENS